MPLNIIYGDITKLDVEAIVNAANSSLMGGGGVDGAIHMAAGPELDEECAMLGWCETGEAVITKGYRLKAKYIIHTVGPIYEDGKHNEAKLLEMCYKNCLELAKKYNIHSIAFPQISTGVFGYPKDEAFEISKNTINEFLKNNNDSMDVYIIIFQLQH